MHGRVSNSSTQFNFASCPFQSFGASEVGGDEVERATSALQLTIVTFLNGSETFDSLGRFDIDLISSSSYSLDFDPPAQPYYSAQLPQRLQ
jgi:hypothetical protein